MRSERNGYRDIGDYAIIGDAHTAALVATDGSIDWCCMPHFDSPAVFCRLLDARRGGSFRVGPSGRFTSSRSYAENTNVLVSTFQTDEGRIRLTDFMPVEPRTADRRGEDVASSHKILRLVEGLAGEVEVVISFRPTFDYARARSGVTAYAGGAVAQSDREYLALICPVSLDFDSSGGLSGRARVAAGQRFWVELSYRAEAKPDPSPIQASKADAELARTLKYWNDWEATCRYAGPHQELVRRSALVLKLLTFEPTGAVVAAPTTSLPEAIGGVRNWDYRFTWLRDSSLMLYALQTLGYHEESMDFFRWLESLCIRCRGGLQIMYTINGDAHLPELTLDHLEGYKGSRPVRIGNAASRQAQLDVFGEVMDAVHFCYETMTDNIRPELSGVLSYLADRAATRWRGPDQGIWEVRGAPRHFLYSKLLCWVALDRAVRLSGRAGLTGDVTWWRRTRDEIRNAILTQGYNAEVGAFTQAFGESSLDASALAIPLVGFLPATDPRVQSTAERIKEQLTSRGLVYRYLNEDGLPGDEVTFALCSFWLVDNLALGGRLDEARELFDKLVSYSSDLGLFAEMIDPSNRELLGNYPQGFTHLALIRSALNMATAEARTSEQPAETPAERSREVAQAAETQATNDDGTK